MEWNGESAEEGLGLKENVCWGIAAGVSLAHTHIVRDTGEGLGLGLCLGIFPVRDSRSQHAIKCFCLINKKINFYETCLKQTTKIDWPDKMQLRFAKPAHTHTHAHTPVHHTHTHTLAWSLSKKCARACGLYVSSLLPESFVFFSLSLSLIFGNCCQRIWRCAVYAVRLQLL